MLKIAFYKNKKNVTVFLLFAVSLLFAASPDACLVKAMHFIPQAVIYYPSVVITYFTDYVGRFIGGFFSIDNLKERIGELTKAIIKLESSVDEKEYMSLIRERDEIYKSLNMKIKRQEKIVSSDIVITGGNNVFGNVIINAGESDGVYRGMGCYSIIDGKRVLAGIVKESHLLFSIVTTVYTPGFSFIGFIKDNGERMIVRAKGCMSKYLYFEKLLAGGSPIGRDVYSTSEGGYVPLVIKVGKIDEADIAGDYYYGNILSYFTDFLGKRVYVSIRLPEKAFKDYR